MMHLLNRLRFSFLAAGFLTGSLMLFPTTPALAFSVSVPSGLSQLIACSLRAGANLNLRRGLHCSERPAGSSASGRHRQTGVPAPQPAPAYAALGDSVAAGLGLPFAANATPADKQCGRSPQAYPSLVAARQHYQLIDAACSGATVGDLFTEQHTADSELAPQLDAAFAQGTPKLITITAGANDAHWTDFLRACYLTDCTASTYTLAADAYLAALKVKLAYLYTDIDARSHGQPPTVLYTGYYQALSPACTRGQSAVTPSEITWLRSETTKLNQTLSQAAAGHAYATFVPLNFTGHDLCSGQSWIQSLADPAPFHPTAAGQQAIARSVIARLRSQ